MTGVPVHCCSTNTGARDILWRHMGLGTHCKGGLLRKVLPCPAFLRKGINVCVVIANI